MRRFMTAVDGFNRGMSSAERAAGCRVHLSLLRNNEFEPLHYVEMTAVAANEWLL